MSVYLFAAFLLACVLTLHAFGFSSVLKDAYSNNYSLGLLIATFSLEVVLALITVADIIYNFGQNTDGTSRSNPHSGSSQGPARAPDAQVADARAEV